MAENTSGDKQQLINRIERFFEQNACENITKYILGSTKISRCVKQVMDYPRYFSNIFSLAFIFAYGCLRCDNDSEEPKNPEFTKQNSLRIVNSLKKAYTQYPVTSELVQFVLSDIQFEMLQSKDEKIEAVFGRICDFRKMKYSLTKYYKVIAEWRAAPSRFKMDVMELLQMFNNLLRNMTFLKNYDLVADETGMFTFVDKEGDEDEDYACVPARHVIFNTEEYRKMFSLYSLEKLETDSGNKLKLVYVAGDGFDSLNFTVSEVEPENEEDAEFHIMDDASDYYYAITGEDWDGDAQQTEVKNSNFIDQVHTINYKYIKNLALAISDAISANRGTKSALYSAYHRRYRDIFKEVEELLRDEPNIERIKLDWDGIVVMLLIESSPTSVLETLFRANQQTFVAVARNLSDRIDNQELSFYKKDENALDVMVNDIIRTKLLEGEASIFGRIPQNPNDERLRARAEAMLIITALSDIHEEKTVEKSICAGNIYDNIGLLREIRTECNMADRIKYVSVILGETFRHLLCFYKGLISYGNQKIDYDAKYYNRFLSDGQIKDKQREMQRAFMEAARAEAAELKQYSSSDYDGVYGMLQRFVELCKDCSSAAQNPGFYSRSLFATLGKHDLLNLAEFRAYVDQFMAMHQSIDEQNVDHWITFALDILRYLRKGSFRSAEETPFKAIYPFAATYNKRNENYDGYRTVTFALNFDVDGDDKADGSEYINVLSEFEYETTHVFYCLPNVLRSNKRWWIDPLLVGFKEFNDIFKE